MKKVFVAITLAGLLTTAALAQERALPDKYPSANTVTLYDSTGVYMEESGLSHVQTHRLIEMGSYAGCKQWSTVKIDYDPLSAWCDITGVVVHRLNGGTDTLVWPEREGNAPVYDYVAPARLIYWGASQKMVEIGHLDLGDRLEVWTYKKGYTYALLQDGSNGLNEVFAALPDNDRERVHASDAKKLFCWYNILLKADKFNVEPEEDKEKEQ